MSFKQLKPILIVSVTFTEIDTNNNEIRIMIGIAFVEYDNNHNYSMKSFLPGALLYHKHFENRICTSPIKIESTL